MEQRAVDGGSLNLKQKVTNAATDGRALFEPGRASVGSGGCVGFPAIDKVGYIRAVAYRVPDSNEFTTTQWVDSRGCGRVSIARWALRIWTSRHFRLDERAISIGYDFEMPEDATLEIVGCSSGCPERFAYIGESHQVGSVASGLPSLEPGEYFLRMSRPLDGEGDGRFEVTLQ